MATENGFINRTAELDFILMRTDGMLRCNLLEIKEIHYSNKREAVAWYEKLKAESSECSDQAKQKLDELFLNMTCDYF